MSPAPRWPAMRAAADAKVIAAARHLVDADRQVGPWVPPDELAAPMKALTEAVNDLNKVITGREVTEP